MSLSQLRRWIKVGGILLSFVLLFVGIGYVVQVYAWASAIHPIVGYTFTTLFALVLGALLLAPWVIFFRLPQALRLPKTEDEFPEYQKQLRKRLSRNPHLLQSEFDMESLGSEEGLQN
ncbi:MAG: hypothetical protein AAFQ98_21305, partial [Bacteroidota bacterium]